MPQQFWSRNKAGERVFDTYYSQAEVDGIVSAIAIVDPYFNQAARRVLFEKNNTASYPNTMTALRKLDDLLIASGDYDGMTDGEKAARLAAETFESLGVVPSV